MKTQMHKYIRLIALLTILLATLASCAGKTQPPVATPAKSPIWPCQYGDFTGDHFTQLNCPEKPAAMWEVELKGAQCTPPIIDGNGRIIVGTDDGVKCISPDGKELWTSSTESHIKAPPALTNEGNIVVPYGEKITLLAPDGKEIVSKAVAKFATFNPVIDYRGHIYLYCMEPKDLANIAPGAPKDMTPASTFTGHIYEFGGDLKKINRILTGILNCPLRVYPYGAKVPGVVFGAKVFDGWREDHPSDPVKWKTSLQTSETGVDIPLEGIEHGIVDMFFASDSMLYFFGHTEHQPYPDELNAPLDEYGNVYRVLLQSYDFGTKLLQKEHWPWMTPDEASQGTYRDFRKHFNRVRFVEIAADDPAFAAALDTEGGPEGGRDEHSGRPDFNEEVKQFVESCTFMIMTAGGKIIGGVTDIRCFDAASNKIIWTLDGDPSTVALDNQGRLYCLERFPQDEKCVLRCYADGRYGEGFKPGEKP